jgi:hypothetical protein
MTKFGVLFGFADLSLFETIFGRLSGLVFAFWAVLSCVMWHRSPGFAF